MKDIEIVAYQSDIMPNYSCCRMECSTEFLKKNRARVGETCRVLVDHRRGDRYAGRSETEAPGISG